MTRQRAGRNRPSPGQGLRKILLYQDGLRFRLMAIGSGIAAFLLFHILAAFPGVTEAAYSRTLGRFFPMVLSNLTAVFPFSVVELLVTTVVIWLLFSAVRGIFRLGKRKGKITDSLKSGALRVGSLLGIIVTLFYALWGFQYARLPLEERHGWSRNDITPSELARLAEEMVNATNSEYVSLHGTDDSWTPTGLPVDSDGLMEPLKSGWREVEAMMQSPLSGFRYGPPKPLLASRLFDYLGLSGFYSPWTGEANYNSGTPPCTLPHVLAHEMAHQRGHARENEANFMGFLAGAMAPDSYPRYSAYLFAQRQLLVALSGHDRQKVESLIRSRLPGVQRDIDAVIAYWARFEGPARTPARQLNNAYLKSQRVQGGIQSYARSVVLLVAYARSRNDSLMPPIVPEE